MKKNYILDVVLFLLAFVCIGTGMMLDFHWFGHGMKGLVRHVHLYSGYLMAVGLLLHLIWHWSWIRSFRKIFKQKN